MVEILETFDASGHPQSLESRARVHKEGLWHRAVNVFLFRTSGRLLIQLRHSEKDVWPSAWDLSVAEHLKPGESFEQAAERGLAEELGICGVPISPMGAVTTSCLDEPEHGIKDWEFQQSFQVVTDQRAIPSVGEVAALREIELEELRVEFLERPAQYTPWFRSRAIELGIV